MFIKQHMNVTFEHVPWLAHALHVIALSPSASRLAPHMCSESKALLPTFRPLHDATLTTYPERASARTQQHITMIRSSFQARHDASTHRELGRSVVFQQFRHLASRSESTAPKSLLHAFQICQPSLTRGATVSRPYAKSRPLGIVHRCDASSSHELHGHVPQTSCSCVPGGRVRGGLTTGRVSGRSRIPGPLASSLGLRSCRRRQATEARAARPLRRARHFALVCATRGAVTRVPHRCLVFCCSCTHRCPGQRNAAGQPCTTQIQHFYRGCLDS